MMRIQVSSQSHCEHPSIVSLMLMFTVSRVDFGLVQPSFNECQHQYVESSLITCKISIASVPKPAHVCPF